MNIRSHWQLYQKLEGLPETVPEPTGKPDVLTLPLREGWKLLMNLLTQELVYEQQIEFLKRCLEQDLLKHSKTGNFWLKFRKLLD